MLTWCATRVCMPVLGDDLGVTGKHSRYRRPGFHSMGWEFVVSNESQGYGEVESCFVEGCSGRIPYAVLIASSALSVH